jgi:hypothetical protein
VCYAYKTKNISDKYLVTKISKKTFINRNLYIVMSRITNLEDLTLEIRGSSKIESSTVNYFRVLIQPRTVESADLETAKIMELRAALYEKLEIVAKEITLIKQPFESLIQLRETVSSLFDPNENLCMNPADKAKLAIRELVTNPCRDLVSLLKMSKEADLIREMILHIDNVYPKIPIIIENLRLAS